MTAAERTDSLIADLRSMAVAEQIAKRDRAHPIYTNAADVIMELQAKVEHLQVIAEWVRYQLPSCWCSAHQFPTPTCRICKVAYNKLERMIRLGRRELVSDAIDARESQAEENDQAPAPVEHEDAHQGR